jgi:hypothetical protein
MTPLHFAVQNTDAKGIVKLLLQQMDVNDCRVQGIILFDK